MSDRRRMLQTSLALGAMQVFPKMSFAQARRLVFATFTGSGFRLPSASAASSSSNNGRSRVWSACASAPRS